MEFRDRPGRRFGRPAEAKRRDQLIADLDRCSEDDLIEEVLIPRSRQLGLYPDGSDVCVEYRWIDQVTRSKPSALQSSLPTLW